MRAQEGFYLMYRGWLDHPAFNGEPYSRRDAWCWLIEKACFQETQIGVKGRFITLQRGQLCHSLRHLAREWKWTEPKVRRFCVRLASLEMIRCVSDAGQNVITICKYEEHQTRQSVADATPDASPTQQRRSSDAIDKEGKEGKEKITPKAPTGAVCDEDAFAKFWEAYPHRDGLLDPEDDARAAFSKAIDAGTPPAEIIAGAERFAGAVREHKVEPAKVNQAKSWLAKKGWRSGAPKAKPALPVKGTPFAAATMNAFLPTDSVRRGWEMAVGLFYRTGEWRGQGEAPGKPGYAGPVDLVRGELEGADA